MKGSKNQGDGTKGRYSHKQECRVKKDVPMRPAQKVAATGEKGKAPAAQKVQVNVEKRLPKHYDDSKTNAKSKTKPK